MARIPRRQSIDACVACLAPQSRSLNCAAASLPADLHDSSLFDENRDSVEVEGEQSQALTWVTVALNVILVELMSQPRQPFTHFLRVRAARGPVNFSFGMACDLQYVAKAARQPFWRATMSKVNFTSSFTLRPPPTAETGLML